MTPFSIFALLYMTAIFLELAEKWTYPLYTSTVLLLVVLVLATRVTRVTFLVFLAVTTAHFLLVQFPDVANHVNVAIYGNVLMMVGIVYSLARRQDFPTDDDCFEMLRPLLQATMVLVYFLAGFHKLNADFLEPTISCVGNTLDRLLGVARSRTIGVPLGIVLLGGSLVPAYRLLSRSPLRRYGPVFTGAGAIALGIAAALLLLRPELPAGARTMAVLGMAGLVILWELVGGPMLAVPRLQAPLLAFSWTMHATLALIGFVDFGALALALLFTFVPRPYLDMLTTRVRVPVIGLAVQRAHLYFAMCVLAGISSGLDNRLASGLIFNLSALVLIWPLLSALAAPASRQAWTGVPLSSRMTPRWLFIFPALLFFHGVTSYLGLRTAGNFSMFSNLRTEGARSNHFLLGNNPLKLWGYQEDVIRFIRINDRQAGIGYQYQPLQGNQLPVVEFRKLIYLWTRAGKIVPLTFEYRGKIHSTEDIANDPAWRTGARNWEMALLDFRSIQSEGRNRCRW